MEFVPPAGGGLVEHPQAKLALVDWKALNGSPVRGGIVEVKDVFT